MNFDKHLLAFALTGSLIGCGGGGSAKTAPISQAPAPNEKEAGVAAASNGCYDMVLFDTQGTSMRVAYTFSGTVTGSQMATTIVGGMTTFEGQAVRETVLTTSGSNSSQGVTAAVNTSHRTYFKRSGDTLVAYGSVATAGGSASGASFTTTLRTVFSPVYVDPHSTLQVGQSVTTIQSGKLYSTVSGVPGTSETAFSNTVVAKFAGQESVTVPAGTYKACKFELSTTAWGSTTVMTHYVIAGSGVLIKMESDGQTAEATSVRLNGAAL